MTRRLVAAARTADSRQTITAPLDYLLKQDRIVRVGSAAATTPPAADRTMRATT